MSGPAIPRTSRHSILFMHSDFMNLLKFAAGECATKSTHFSATFSLCRHAPASPSIIKHSTTIISLSQPRCRHYSHYRQPWGHGLFSFLRAIVMEQDHAPCLGLGLASALAAHTLLLAIPPCRYSFFYIEYHPYKDLWSHYIDSVTLSIYLY